MFFGVTTSSGLLFGFYCVYKADHQFVATGCSAQLEIVQTCLDPAQTTANDPGSCWEDRIVTQKVIVAIQQLLGEVGVSEECGREADP